MKILIRIISATVKLFIKEKFCSIFEAEKFYNRVFDESLLIKCSNNYSYEIKTINDEKLGTVSTYSKKAWKKVYNINIKEIN